MNTVSTRSALKSALAITILLVAFSCKKEKIEPAGSNEPRIEFKERDLATIELSNGITVEFKAESDGISYQMNYTDDSQWHALEKLKEAGPLEQFLSLTSEDVAVPNDMITLEDDQTLIEKAKQRGVTDSYVSTIKSRVSIDQFADNSRGNRCGNNSGFGYVYSNITTYPSRQYTRSYEEWALLGSHKTVYSSTGGGKCRRIYFDITNCNDSSNKNIVAEAYVKFGGIYYKNKTVYIGEGQRITYGKTFTYKSYRKVTFNNTNNVFPSIWNYMGGYVQFSKY